MDNYDNGLLGKLIVSLEGKKTEEQEGEVFRFRNPCPVVNYFHCPHPEDKGFLIFLGHIILYIRTALNYNSGSKIDIFSATADELNSVFDSYREHRLDAYANSTTDCTEEYKHHEKMKSLSLQLIEAVKMALADPS